MKLIDLWFGQQVSSPEAVEKMNGWTGFDSNSVEQLVSMV